MGKWAKLAFGTSGLMYQIFQECSKHSIKCTKCTITFQTTFFLKQNYRLTIIHSQTLQLSCNSFKLPQESCYLYSIYILYQLSRHLNFPHIIQALNPFHLSKPHQKPYTPIQKLHTLSKMYLHMFFFIYSLLKTEISTQTFQIPIIYLPVHNLFRVSTIESVALATILHKLIKLIFTN